MICYITCGFVCHALNELIFLHMRTLKTPQLLAVLEYGQHIENIANISYFLSHVV
jgi:hypothetical protein